MERVPTGLPLEFHDDGTPIFERGDFIREPRPLPPHNDSSAVMYDELMLPEHKALRSEIRINMILMAPNQRDRANEAWLGKSYPDPKRDFQFGRVIQALDSTCRVILQRWEKPGYISDYVMLSMQSLQLAVVPPNYETILVNVSGKTPARFFEMQAREEKRNTDVITELKGPGYIVKSSGQLEVNAEYDELPIPRIHPGLTEFKFLKRRPLYEMFAQYPKGFDFIDPPRLDFFSGAV